jgi:methylated-DNA-[protein]-cysteine S-methyltransferase
MKTHPHLLLERWESPIGPLLIVTDQEGNLRALEFGENEDRLRRLVHNQYGDVSLEKGKTPPPITKALTAYFRGDVGAINRVPTVTNGTDFQREVWKALRQIPAGTTISYGELARRVGRPAASRAVGAANGANPIPIVVPCHRVIGANGSLTGFGSGLPRKKWLLEHESRHIAVAAGDSLL